MLLGPNPDQHWPDHLQLTNPAGLGYILEFCLYISRGWEADHSQSFEMKRKSSKSETNRESGNEIELWTFNCQVKILGFVLLSFFKSSKVIFDEHTHQ
jgi:hypothetical protein